MDDAEVFSALADALSAFTVPDGDTRERLLRLISEYMPGRDGIPKVQDVWLADAILAAFPVLGTAAPEPEWEYGLRHRETDDLPSAWYMHVISSTQEGAAAWKTAYDQVVRRRKAGPWETLPVGGGTDGER